MGRATFSFFYLQPILTVMLILCYRYLYIYMNLYVQTVYHINTWMCMYSVGDAENVQIFSYLPLSVVKSLLQQLLVQQLLFFTLSCDKLVSTAPLYATVTSLNVTSFRALICSHHIRNNSSSETWNVYRTALCAKSWH